MAAVSAASGTTTTITPPETSHGDHSGWRYPSAYQENSMHQKPFPDFDNAGSAKAVGSSHNGYSSHEPYDEEGRHHTREPRAKSRTNASDHKRRNPDPSDDLDDEESKWIHRDKLAKIESQELQAAGIILPKPRAQSRPRRERSPEKMNGHRRGTDASEQQPLPMSRKNSDHGFDRTPDIEIPSWDLRLPEEIAEDPGEYWVSPETGRGSRIPVAKLSPAPLPADYIDRDAPVQRKSSNPVLDEEASISIPKSRSRSGSANVLDDKPKLQSGKRSATDGSPRKGSVATRKTSAPTKPTAQGRPKTRSGPTPRSGSSTRPSTRSGELSPTARAPEGDPPWMISAYKPDPRLPPDQQLLPTVAKRLQQEKWEQEGKFGNVYDKEFRPLNDEPFLLKPQETEKPTDAEEPQGEWPLRQDTKSPTTTSRPGTSSYSTMPRIQDMPAISPLSSPRPIQQPQMQTNRASKMPEPPEQMEEKPKKSGCGCCIVM
ncbi:hypothetical protein F4778DRAFT_25545 [Xylariomycetidae sp. FL2044]|nr:hypothetical protein F4778DRAFT_25545 [Xylariomycetidae sp. FL2044]